MKYAKLQQICCLLTCLLMLAAVAISRDGKLLGHELREGHQEPDLSGYNSTGAAPTLRTEADGTIVISTQEIAKDIMGYGGNVPLEIYLKDGRITDIKPLRNAETPEFFEHVTASGLFARWTGLTPEEALQTQVDAVSGATFSSKAVIGTVMRGLQYAEGIGQDAAGDAANQSVQTWEWASSPKFWCTAAVILCGSLLPLFIRNRRYRIVQQILNIAVLGLWSGSFISYSLLVNSLANGIHWQTTLIPVLLLIVAFVFPLFGKKSHYCTWICPLGSLQEVAGMGIKRKIRMKPATVRLLGHVREGLWAALMLMMWSGVGFQWMGYELFTAFLFRQASVWVIITAVLFVLLSCFIPRPYCRFVCPTGTILHLSQNIKSE